MQWNPKLYRESFGQVTDVRVIFPSTSKRWENLIEYNVPTILDQGTRGTHYEGQLYLFAYHDLTEQARKVVRLIENQRIISDAINILDLIRKQVASQWFMGDLPPIRAFNGEDNSLLIEWISPKFRIGFSIEKYEKDSGWYLVSKPASGGINASGFLSGVDTQILVSWLVSLVTSKLFA